MIAKVDNDLWDLSRLIDKSCKLKILTKKDPETLAVLRHDAAHIMAEAVLELFPDTQITIGPAIENGFYYDFYRLESFVLEDLNKIEKRMHEIVIGTKKFIVKFGINKKLLNFLKRTKKGLKLSWSKVFQMKKKLHFIHKVNL